jgi:hypothetical protein
MCWWILNTYFASCDIKHFDVTGSTNNIDRNEDYFLCGTSLTKKSYQEDATDGKDSYISN